MYHITLSEEIKRLCPAFQGVAVMAQVTNSAHNSELWREIDAFTRELRAGETAESIQRKLLRRTTGGSIICLHDGRGKDEAPARTIAALRKTIPLWLERGYRFDTVDHYENKTDS